MRWAIDALEPRRLLAGFSLDVADTITVPAGKTIQVPVTATGAAGVEFDADPTSGLNAGFHSDANPFVELSTSRGTMRFELLADVAPNTVRRIVALAQSGYYDGQSFNRVIDRNGFRIAQGGGGNGSAPLFDDEFDADAIFDGSGQLAMVNGAKDANRSAFFITGGPQRSSDFNYTIFGQLVRGGDVLESILATADDTADPTVATPLSPTTIQSARLVESDGEGVMQIRAGTATGLRSVVVSAVDDAGNRVSKTVQVNVVPETNNTPPILATPAGDRFVAEAGKVVDVPFDVIDLEGEPYDVRLNLLVGGSGVDVNGSSIDLASKLVRLRIKSDFAGEVRFALGVRAQNATARGSIIWEPGDDATSLRTFDTQTISIAVGGIPIAKVKGAGTLAARTGDAGALKDATLATFASDATAGEGDFSATIDWGDGSTDDARVKRLSKGSFAVIAGDGHAYARDATMPITIDISGTNGSRVTTGTTASVSNPASLSADGTLSISGTGGDDRVRLSTGGGAIVVRVNGDDFDFDARAVRRIVADLFDGNDELLTVDATGLPAMEIHGGAGNDSLYGNDAADTIYGDAGDDQLYGNGGDDVVWGGDGNDTILGGGGKNKLYGEAGIDRVVGGGGRDFISGGDGSDRLYGRAGNDTLEGNAGTDRLYGEDGDDKLVGGGSNDRCYGGEGNDSIWGNQGADTLIGGPGVNRLGDKDDDDHEVVDLIFG